MQNFIKRTSFSFIIACSISFFSSAQNASQFIENDPAQYGKPFANMPDRRDVTIYQVNIRAFSKGGNLKGVSERLDSIKALGVNVIYLMPVYPVGQAKAVNSPYCVKDYKAVNPEFGSLDDLRDVIEKAHKRNMAVLLDWVPNHTAFDHVWINNKSWYQQDSAGNIISPPGMGWNDVAQLNFKNTDMRLAMINAMKYWILTANADGYRCDFTDGPGVDFWKQALDTLRNISTHKLLMLSEGRRSDLFYQVGFDYNYGFRFFDLQKNIYNKNESVRAIDSLNLVDYAGSANGQQIIRYTSNHDVNGSDGTPIDLFGGERGSMTAFVVVAYMKGIPMIYNGQEVGTPYRLTFPFTSKKIDWSLNPSTTAEYKKLIAFRNKSNAIRRGELNSYSSDDVCAFTKTSGKEKVLVISNVRNKSVDYSLPSSLANSSWINVITDEKEILKQSVLLPPYTYLILKNE